jgi:MFS family permease
MKSVLPKVIIAQFFCTSLWFSGNAILPELVGQLQLDSSFFGHFTSIIQFGFVAGTLLFALFSISDRYAPAKVFFVSAVLAGLFNWCICISTLNAHQLLFLRFSTGFFLAGIYPVGIKIVADYYVAGLGKSLGFLVGALVLGSALPHLLKNIVIGFPWKYVIYSTTILSFVGGFFVWLYVPNGPYRKAGEQLKFNNLLLGFKKFDFKMVAVGYFGHMWELYTFWAFVPIMLTAYNQRYATAQLNVSILSFFIIASGAVACSFSGIISQYFGARKVAICALLISCICCMVSPLFVFNSSPILFVLFLFIWGLAVIADSPMLSALVAQNAPVQSKGTSITIVNCIGFSFTIISVEFMSWLYNNVHLQYIYTFLAIGPILSIIALCSKQRATSTST